MKDFFPCDVVGYCRLYEIQVGKYDLKMVK